MGRAFPKHLQFLPLNDEIALGRRQRGETQAFAFSGIGADPSCIMRRDSADWFRKEPCRSPASTGLFAAKLRARYFQVRSAQSGWHRVLWIANGEPLVARTGPVSGRLGERCAAGPKQHHQYDTQAGRRVRSFSEFPVWAVLSHARAWLIPTPVDIIEN